MKGPHRAPASLARGPREKAYHQKVTVPVLQGRVCVCVCVCWGAGWGGKRLQRPASGWTKATASVHVAAGPSSQGLWR